MLEVGSIVHLAAGTRPDDASSEAIGSHPPCQAVRRDHPNTPWREMADAA